MLIHQEGIFYLCFDFHETKLLSIIIMLTTQAWKQHGQCFEGKALSQNTNAQSNVTLRKSTNLTGFQK